MTQHPYHSSLSYPTSPWDSSANVQAHHSAQTRASSRQHPRTRETAECSAADEEERIREKGWAV